MGLQDFKVTSLGFSRKPKSRLGFITNMCWDLNFGNKFAKGFTKQRVQFQPPTRPTLTFEEDYSYFEVELPLVVYVPLVWDMEDMYGASERPC